MDMLVEIVNLLGPPSLCELKQMKMKLDDECGDDPSVDDDSNCSSFINLILSIRTFKTYEERLKDKLEYTRSGRQTVPTEIVNIIFNTLQYIAENRLVILPNSEEELSIEE